MNIKFFILLVSLIVSVASAAAAIREQTYEQKVRIYNQQVSKIASFHELDENLTFKVKQSSLIWILGGPCSSPLPRQVKDEFIPLLRFLSLPNGGKYEVALHHIIGVLMVDSLGRMPDSDLCKYAKEFLSR